MLKSKIALAALIAVAAGQNSTVGAISTSTVHLPSSQPAFAQKLSPYLAAMSIEMDRWPDWAVGQVGTPNQFLNTALGNLRQRTGLSTWFRIGAALADSQDAEYLNTTLQVSSTIPGPVTAATPYPEAWAVYIGRDFYALSQNLPAGTQFTWGLNFRSLNKTETVAQAALLADTFQGSRAKELKNPALRSVEIGNEPDRFNSTAVPMYTPYSGGWTVLNYTTTWIDFARGVMQVMDFSGNLKLLAAPFSGGGTWSTFNAISTFEAGLLDASDVKKVKNVYSSHTYQAVTGTGPVAMPGQLMNKQSLRQNVTLRLNDLRAAEKEGLDNIWGETSSYAHHGSSGTSNTAESAIFGVDYMLYSATVGMSRVHWHNGYGYRYNVLQPFSNINDDLNSTGPHIMPLYHAHLIVSEAIGTSGNSWVAEIGTASSSLAAYGIWEKSTLVRMVFVNSVLYAPDLGSVIARPQIKVVLQGSQVLQQATVKYLHTPATDAYHGITWAGQSFDTASAVPSGSIVEQPIVNGTFLLEASSVALVTFSS